SSDGDTAEGIAVDASGNAYVTGPATSVDFPITAGAFQTTLRGSGDAFVTKLNPSGSALVYSTYLGGSGADGADAIAVDTVGNAYVAGVTGSIDFPTTLGAFQTTLRGDSDAFVTKLSPSGSALIYSTYLGGSSSEHGLGIAVDAAGNAFRSDEPRAADAPTTPGAPHTPIHSTAYA